jgi:hypothetical protein
VCIALALGLTQSLCSRGPAHVNLNTMIGSAPL